MVRYVPDNRHGFGERPHYDPRELDRTFERLAVKFLKDKYGETRFPFETEDLKTFIEADVHSLDQYADLTMYGPGVEGLTEFRPRVGEPKVAVSSTLQGNENRLRMTLAHEYGHVHLHGYLFEMRERQVSGLPQNHNLNGIYCKRETIESAAKSDWLEWQASYAGSALLAPASIVGDVVRPLLEQFGIFGPVSSGSEHGAALIAAVAKAFKISRDAARVRLSVLEILGAPRATGSLFS
jgi:hypothetical protein